MVYLRYLIGWPQAWFALSVLVLNTSCCSDPSSVFNLPCPVLVNMQVVSSYSADVVVWTFLGLCVDPCVAWISRSGIAGLKMCVYVFWIVVQSLSCVWLFATPQTASCQASLSLTISWSLLKLMSFESVIPSHHLILCRPLLLLSSVFPSIKVFSSELAAKVLELQLQSFQWIFGVDFL